MVDIAVIAKKNMRWIIIALILLCLGTAVYVNWESINREMTHPYSHSEE